MVNFWTDSVGKLRVTIKNPTGGDIPVDVAADLIRTDGSTAFLGAAQSLTVVAGAQLTLPDFPINFAGLVGDFAPKVIVTDHYTGQVLAIATGETAHVMAKAITVVSLSWV